MIPTIQTKIKREAEKKYMTNSRGFFKLYEPNNVLTPIIKKSKDRSKTATFLIQIRKSVIYYLSIIVIPAQAGIQIFCL
jgi:hypothetical protein